MTRVNPEGFRPEALVGQVLRGKWRLERLLGFGGRKSLLVEGDQTTNV